MKNKKNLVVEKITHERLRVLGAKDESFDSIINRLLDFFDAHKEAKPS
jgi:hypothetical protein